MPPCASALSRARVRCRVRMSAVCKRVEMRDRQPPPSFAPRRLPHERRVDCRLPLAALRLEPDPRR
eukprot:12855363-Alexandrium_andersonii.AAC.1